MKLNPVKWLLNDEGRNPPALLAVTPPRTGERTLLGVENMLGSIAAPRTLLPGAGRGRGRRDPHGLLPQRPGGAGARSQPATPRRRYRRFPPGTIPCAWARRSRHGR